MSDYTGKQQLREGWQEWVKGLTTWRSFVTLTFRDMVTNDQAEHQFRFLIQVLNRDLFGKNYTRIVHHSYFGYLVAYEHQKRGALHLHALINDRVNFQLIHTVWNKMAGFVWIEPVKDLDRSIGYISKYVTKGGDLSLYMPAKVKQPAFKPMWYMGL